MAKLKAKTRIQYSKSRKTTPAKKISLHENLKGIVAKIYHTPGFPVKLTENESGVKIPNRVQLFKTGTFKKNEIDGTSSEIKITPQILKEIVQNFQDEVRGIDLAIDFAHRSDEEAAGWIKGLTIETHGHETQLWAEVEWTPDGKAALSGKRFRYLSPDFAFAYIDNETGDKFGATLFGAGLTNRPVIKNMAPAVELTEVDEMAKKTTTTKKIWDLSKEELETRLAEEKDEEKKEFIQHRLNELAEEGDDGGESDQDDDNPAPAADDKKKDKKMTYAELEKQCQEMAEKIKNLEAASAKQASEIATEKKLSTFKGMVAKGIAVPAQEKAFMDGDTIKFAELAQPVKTKGLGDNGKPVETVKTASEEIKTLSEKVIKDGLAKPSEAVSLVFKEHPELEEKYNKEMGYTA